MNDTEPMEAFFCVISTTQYVPDPFNEAPYTDIVRDLESHGWRAKVSSSEGGLTLDNKLPDHAGMVTILFEAPDKSAAVRMAAQAMGKILPDAIYQVLDGDEIDHIYD
jgi:hypothetical protein